MLTTVSGTVLLLCQKNFGTENRFSHLHIICFTEHKKVSLTVGSLDRWTQNQKVFQLLIEIVGLVPFCHSIGPEILLHHPTWSHATTAASLHDFKPKLPLSLLNCYHLLTIFHFPIYRVSWSSPPEEDLKKEHAHQNLFLASLHLQLLQRSPGDHNYEVLVVLFCNC